MKNQTFAEKLASAHAAFEANTTHDAYKRDALPEVLAYLKEYIATGKYPYNAQVEAYIKARETVPTELDDYLGTEVYLAHHTLDRENEAILDARMAIDGFHKVSPDMQYRGRALLRAKKDIDWLTMKIETAGTFVDGARTGAAFFILKGRRTRGYSTFDLKGYYQPLV